MNKDIITHNLVMSKAHHPFLSLSCGSQHLIHWTRNIIIYILCNILGARILTKNQTKHTSIFKALQLYQFHLLRWLVQVDL
jgi:hypothetical protein